MKNEEIAYECAMFWDRANTWATINGYDLLKNKIDQIVVKKTALDEIICYKGENIFKNGWCYTRGWKNSGGWGICSESCKYLKHSKAEIEKEKTSEDYNKV